MRYKEAIDMTNDMIKKLEDGKIKLQSGQWVRFGFTLSRYIGRTKSGSLWMIHSACPLVTSISHKRYYKLNKHFQETQKEK